MSKYPFFLRCIVLPLATLLGMALTMTAQTPVLGVEAAQLDGFTRADGTNVFALTVKPSPGYPLLRGAAHGPRDVVVLVNTAASQAGDYRAESLATLRSTLAKLNPNDRVKLVAFDLNATPLTPGFVAPQGAEMAAALAVLNQRTPLGSCDLEKALDTAAKSFQGGSKASHAIVYIGDGSSRANVLSIEQVDRLVNDLVAQRAPVITFGVGPQIQEQVLGTLASRTGGVVVAENMAQDADFYGTRLAQAVRGSVFWPKAANRVKWPEGMDVYPKTLPPLRSDRDTVLVGSEKSPAAKQVEIDVDGPGGARKLTWNIPKLQSRANNGYLSALLDQAKVDGGRTLPLVDSASLAAAKEEIEAGGRGLTALARQALFNGDLQTADKLAGEALNRNPSDLATRAIKDAVAKKSGVVASPAVAAAVKTSDAPLAGGAGDLNLQGGDAGLPPPDGAAAARQISEGTALEAQWQKDVQNTINKARSAVRADPDGAETLIRQKTSDLTAVGEMRPEMRDRLMGMLRAANKEINRRKEEFNFREQQRIREAAAQREMEMTNAALKQDQDKLKQLMERFDALMAEGRFRLAEESAALEARKIADRSVSSAEPAVVAAGLTSRIAGAYTDLMAVRVAKQKGIVDAIFQTEKLHAPTPDDPPIVYADAELWKELTARRGEKYSAKELSRRSPAEKKIEEALKQLTQMEFVETPLKDVVEYLKDLHHIEIQLDSAALKEAGVDESTPVTKNLKGISLRSALKLVLDELQLTYVIHNEVLLITSPTKAENDYLVTKVYPVAELVLPIKETGFTGGFGNLGGRGNGLGASMNSMNGGSSSMSPMNGPGMNGPSMNGPGMNGPGMNGPGMNFTNGPNGGNGPGNGFFNVLRELLPGGK